jgi:hypothetical protein
MSASNLPVPEDGAIMASRRTTLLGLVVVDDVVAGERKISVVLLGYATGE